MNSTTNSVFADVKDEISTKVKMRKLVRKSYTLTTAYAEVCILRSLINLDTVAVVCSNKPINTLLSLFTRSNQAPPRQLSSAKAS